MAILDPGRTIRTLTKNHVLLQHVLGDIDPGVAAQRRDGSDGWSVHFVVCHLWDYEGVFGRRVTAILDTDRPALEAMDAITRAQTHDYAGQDFSQIAQALFERRMQLLQTLKALPVSAWARIGKHPEFGPGSLLDVCTNACMHDIDHLEQITRCRA